jgi:hypothetical protein
VKSSTESFQLLIDQRCIQPAEEFSKPDQRPGDKTLLSSKKKAVEKCENLLVFGLNGGGPELDNPAIKGYSRSATKYRKEPL